MGLAVINTIGLRELFKPVDSLSVFVYRPINAISSQRTGCPNEINHVPAGIAITVLARVRVLQVPVEGVPQKLIVKAQAVIAKRAGFRRIQLLHDFL